MWRAVYCTMVLCILSTACVFGQNFITDNIARAFVKEDNTGAADISQEAIEELVRAAYF